MLNIFIIYMGHKLNWMLCILMGNPNPWTYTCGRNYIHVTDQETED